MNPSPPKGLIVALITPLNEEAGSKGNLSAV